MTTDKRKISYKTPTPGLVIIRSSDHPHHPILPHRLLLPLYVEITPHKTRYPEPGTPALSTSQQQRHRHTQTAKATAAANTTIPKLAAFAIAALGIAGMMVDVGLTGVLVLPPPLPPLPPVGCAVPVPFVCVMVVMVAGGMGVVAHSEIVTVMVVGGTTVGSSV